MGFEFPHDLRDEYERRLRARIDAAAEALEAVFDRLRDQERASPATWDAALREAELIYREAFDFQANLELAESIVDGISSRQAAAWANAFEVTEAGARLPDIQRQQAIKAQLDAISALVDRYYANMRDNVAVDRMGFIILLAGAAAAAGAEVRRRKKTAAAAAKGVAAAELIREQRDVARRRAGFYATDQVGLVYRETYKNAAIRAGVGDYVWGRTTSLNPRERHLARVGQIFSFSDPIDHPGEAYNCKCDILPIPR